MQPRLRPLLGALFAALVSTSVASAARPDSAVGASVRFVPGEPRLGDLVAVYVANEDPAVQKATATAFEYSITLFRVDKRTLRGVFAVPMDIAARSYMFSAQIADASSKAWLTVLDRDWARSELTVNRRFTRKKGKKLRARLKRERGAWAAIFKPEPTPPAFSGPITRPVTGEVTATFGTRRMFNGRTKSRHYGLDLNGQNGDPIVAVQAGRVVMSAMRWASGGTTIIDHGHGLFTAYFHMSRRNKKVGDTVKAGELIGKVGSSGRVTGPHLHLAVLVRQVKDTFGGPRKPRGMFIDPERFLTLELDGSPPAHDDTATRR